MSRPDNEKVPRHIKKRYARLIAHISSGGGVALIAILCCLGGSAEAAPSTNVSAVPTNVSPPTISGTAQYGSTLTEGPATWTGNPTSISVQWLRCNGGCNAIPGATASTYQLGSSDAGNTIVVQETASNAVGAGVPASSAPTATVNVPSSVTFVSTPATAVTNQPLTMIATVTSPLAALRPSGSVALLSNGDAIPGCTHLAVRPSGQSVTVFCQASFAASAPNLSASFTPASESLLLASSSPSTPTLIQKAAISTSLAAPARVDAGAQASFVVNVRPTAGNGPVQVSGRVGFFDRGKPIGSCRRQRLKRGQATCSIAYPLTATHRISARYGGDTNFRPSSTRPRIVTVQPAGNVTSNLSWTFFYTPKYTTVKSFVVSPLAPGMSISIACHGGGCPFSQHTDQVPDTGCARGKPVTSRCAGPMTDLTSLVGTHQLAVGTQITITLTHQWWTGKYYEFTMQAGKQPTNVISCLAVGGTRPGAGCTSS